MGPKADGCIYFVRHGESWANTRRVIANRGLSYGLTERGRQQAQALAARLPMDEVKLVYHSPLARAAETAAILSGGRVPCWAEEALRECDCGICEGRDDLAAWALHGATMARWRAGDWAARIEGGESLDDVRRRFVPFIEQVQRGLGADTVVLVTHGALVVSMLPLLLPGLDPAFADHGLGHLGYVQVAVCAQGLCPVRWESGA